MSCAPFRDSYFPNPFSVGTRITISKTKNNLCFITAKQKTMLFAPTSCVNLTRKIALQLQTQKFLKPDKLGQKCLQAHAVISKSINYIVV